MLFNSIDFIFFFPIVVLLFFSVPLKMRWMLLLFASYFFYAYWKVEYLALIVLTTITSYIAAIKIDHIKEGDPRRKYPLYLCLAINLGILFIFKYYNFALNSIRDVVTLFDSSVEFSYVDLLLPVGISFYTFQTISYVIDVYRGEIKPERHIGVFALYVTFFPQLVAGPIERSSRLLPQFYIKNKFCWDNLYQGLLLIIWGFFLKIVIADRLAPYVNTIYNEPALYTGGHFLIATYFFAVQIFCDFAGYSIIAVGCARVMGYDLMMNFRRPYLAVSIQDFWSRWHISLSTWFRDYLYIPLGGNRLGPVRHSINVMTIFVVSGLWHGANWTFFVWGALNGGYLVLANWRRKLMPKPITLVNQRVNHMIDVIVTFHLACFAWIFFRANSLSDAGYIITNFTQGWKMDVSYFGSLIAPFGGGNMAVATFITSLLLVSVMFLVHMVEEYRPKRLIKYWEESSYFSSACFGVALAFILLFGKLFTEAAFIYFQF